MGILIGPPIGGLLQPIVASYTAMSCVGGALLYVIFILDESLSERSKAEVNLFPFMWALSVCHSLLNKASLGDQPL